MNAPIRILYVDDYPLDRLLVRDALEKEHGGFEVTETATQAEFEAALATGGFDLVLSDFNILGFQGLQVLDAVHASDPRLPVVIVTGTGSEEVAVEAMKRGAADYVIKTVQHIQRLPLTIHAVLEKKRLQDEHQWAEEQFKAIYENAVEGICQSTLEGRYMSVNPAMARIYRYESPEEMIAQITDIQGQMYVRPEDRAEFIRLLTEQGKVEQFEAPHYRKDGSIIWIQTNARLVRRAGREPFFEGFVTDITERKLSEQKIERQLQRLSALRVLDAALSAHFDLPNILDVLLSCAIQELCVDAATIFLLDARRFVLECAASSGFRSQAIHQMRVGLGDGYAGRVALERRLLQVPNLSDYADKIPPPSHLAGEAFASYYGVPLIAKGEVKGVLEVWHRTPLEAEQEWLDFFHTLAGQAAIAINDAMLLETLQQSNNELTHAYDATIEGWSRALDLRDHETEGHTQRVKELTLELARRFGLSAEELVYVRWGALLHDIGKMGVPDEILLKPASLTEAEWAIMKKHPTFAYEMLSPIRYLKSAIDIPYCHHEKWDGTGYPRGLKGEEIPLTARLFAVVDVWDALRSDRPYRAGWSSERVRDYLRAQAGTHFDQQAVELFLQLMGDA